jgi:hypothetical protein
MAALLAAPPRRPDIGAEMSDSTQEIHSASACVPNIGPRGRRRRYIVGAVALAFALVGASRVLYLRMPPLAMVGPGLAFLAAALGYFEAREKT